MNRRQFLLSGTAGLFTTLLSGSIVLPDRLTTQNLADWMPGDPQSKTGPAPLPEITAVVDIIVPPDPEIPGDFKGSDYGGDWALAATLGDLGQFAASMMLNKYARQVNGKAFMDCTAEEQMLALKQWIIEREDINPTLNEMLTGVLTVSMIGTYEPEDPELAMELYERMGWYDPKDPTNSFRIPCEGYPDAKQLPVRLKKGLRDEN